MRVIVTGHASGLRENKMGGYIVYNRTDNVYAGGMGSPILSRGGSSCPQGIGRHRERNFL